ncbi:flavodoxin family protein [Peptacetobacter hominis]|uniref:Flavodoxin family protein n=1 Tax=Peptacetobacter hominis TaxID=2743610 RepID=A0A544QX10_9FIRM|nr:flavodoxin family protein [Peptacetobacter hominis]TQQ85211.1 flavodoxin family protein [Peptacetobacter hominis]
MNLMLSDINIPEVLKDDETCRYIDISKLKIADCLGCFGCWVKTPGRCVIRDDATEVYPLIARSENLIYVTRVVYGSYDETLKRMFERSIPVQQAFIRIHNGETHHVQRNVLPKKAVIIAYGDISDEEKKVFEKLVERNSNNMMITAWKIYFVNENELENKMIEEAEKWKRCL